MSNIKGFTKATLSLDSAEHDIQSTLSADAEMVGGKLHFKRGVRLHGSLTGCDEIVCDGMLIVESGAKIQARVIRARNLASMGEVRGEHCTVTGTLIAWAGTFQVAKIDYATFEKSSDCVVKGSLDQIEPEAAAPAAQPAYASAPSTPPAAPAPVADTDAESGYGGHSALRAVS